MERGADVSTGNNVGATPLMHAVRRGHAELVALLLAKGAHINRTDLEGLGPHTTHARAQPAHSAKTHPRPPQTAAPCPHSRRTARPPHSRLTRTAPARVRGATESNHKTCAGTVSVRTGNCALSLAVSAGSGSIVAALLLAHGADPHARDPAGRPLVYAAVKGGDPALVQLLADAGADLETSGCALLCVFWGWVGLLRPHRQRRYPFWCVSMHGVFMVSPPLCACACVPLGPCCLCAWSSQVGRHGHAAAVRLQLPQGLLRRGYFAAPGSRPEPRRAATEARPEGGQQGVRGLVKDNRQAMECQRDARI